MLVSELVFQMREAGCCVSLKQYVSLINSDLEGDQRGIQITSRQVQRVMQPSGLRSCQKLLTKQAMLVFPITFTFRGCIFRIAKKRHAF